MVVVLFGIKSIVRLPLLVNEFTFLPVVSSLKLPPELLGAMPAIKLAEAGIQLGVNGSAPCWLKVVIVNEALAEIVPAKDKKSMMLEAILRGSSVMIFTTGLFFAQL